MIRQRKIQPVVVLPSDRVQYTEDYLEVCTAIWVKVLQWVTIHSGAQLYSPQMPEVRSLSRLKALPDAVTYGGLSLYVERPAADLPRLLAMAFPDLLTPKAQYRGSFSYEDRRTDYFFIVVGGGEWAGYLPVEGNAEEVNYAIVGEAAIGPLMRYYSRPYLDTSTHLGYRKAAFGTWIHELIHMLLRMVGHPPRTSPPNVMNDHFLPKIDNPRRGAILVEHQRLIQTSIYTDGVLPDETLMRRNWQRWWEYIDWVVRMGAPRRPED